MTSIKYAGLTDLGCVRQENQDNWTVDSSLGLYVVADGMGGIFGGGLASKIIAEVLPSLVRREFAEIRDWDDSESLERLNRVLGNLSNLLREGGEEVMGPGGMGSTVVILLIKGSKAIVGHMGDSRAYLLRRGKIKLLTTDHTIVQLLIESGDITPEEAATHPSCGQLTRYVGMQAEPLPEVCSLEICPGDRFLLCSDGLTGMLNDEQILTILKQRLAPKTTCKRLVEAANKAGGRDNIAVVVLTVSNSST